MNDRMIEHRLVVLSVHNNVNSCISTQSALNISISIFQLVVLVLYIIPHNTLAGFKMVIFSEIALIGLLPQSYYNC